jgi:gp16 family phage-associated protein
MKHPQELPVIPYPQTPKTAHAWFFSHGICISDWCRAHQLERMAVVDLLRGKRKGCRGNAHRAAVALGLKAAPEKLAA